MKKWIKFASVVVATFMLCGMLLLASPWIVDHMLEHELMDGPGYISVSLHQGIRQKIDKIGFAHLNKRTRIDEGTLFDLASNSKQFTAMAVFLLIAECIVSVCIWQERN